MRAPFELFRSARFALVLAAFGAVLPLVEAAAAQDAFGFNLEALLPGLRPALAPTPAVVAGPPHRHARRIWAASHARPLRAAASRHPRATRAADRRTRGAIRTAQMRPFPEPQVVFPKLIVLPKPPRPAIVSIYQDRTLRTGDAVMMADGIHVFRGREQEPHRPGDFVRLAFAASLDWRLRESLAVFDQNPPTRWSSNGSVAG